MLKNNQYEIHEGELVHRHERVKGDIAPVKKAANRKKWKVINAESKPTLEYLHPSQLTPIETQRDTKTNWAANRLDDLGGLDMNAFGALSVAYDENDKKHYLWDGCGRDLLASVIDSEMRVPCLVYKMSRVQAAFYFSYTQHQGRRSLSKESIFVNSWASGDIVAIKWGERLRNFGLKISANDDFNAPFGLASATPSSAIEISEKGIKESWKIANAEKVPANELIIEQAKDMIFSAFSEEDENGVKTLDRINSELLWAMIKILMVYPKSRTGDLNEIILKFLRQKYDAGTQNKFIKETKAAWSIPGMNKAEELSTCLAFAIVTDIRENRLFVKHPRQSTLKNDFVINRITPPILMKKTSI